ncbi:unnamed protein product [Dicrocoelium dendriticum]|nr:unnamed protein product [Dicrocoelium dendriticum]
MRTHEPTDSDERLALRGLIMSWRCTFFPSPILNLQIHNAFTFPSPLNDIVPFGPFFSPPQLSVVGKYQILWDSAHLMTSPPNMFFSNDSKDHVQT